jgi:hypothetical protein
MSEQTPDTTGAVNFRPTWGRGKQGGTVGGRAVVWHRWLCRGHVRGAGAARGHSADEDGVPVVGWGD